MVVAPVQWVSNIVLVSDGPQSDSVSRVVHGILDFMYVFRFFSTRGDSRVLTLIPCVELDHLGASPFIQGPANLFVPAALESLQRCLSAGVPLRWFSA